MKMIFADDFISNTSLIFVKLVLQYLRVKESVKVNFLKRFKKTSD